MADIRFLFKMRSKLPNPPRKSRDPSNEHILLFKERYKLSGRKKNSQGRLILIKRNSLPRLNQSSIKSKFIKQPNNSKPLLSHRAKNTFRS